jgi:ABC-2 type transport system permease protein
VLIAVALAAVGANARVRLVGWLAVVAAFALTILGPLFKLWDWIPGISPFWHVPNVTANPDWSGLTVVGLVAVILTGVAFAGFRRRDIT